FRSFLKAPFQSHFVSFCRNHLVEVAPATQLNTILKEDTPMAAVSEPETLDLEAKNLALEHASPQEILAWAVEQFRGSLCMSTSFQLGGMILIDMLSKIDPTMPTLFVDTTFHFKETLEFRDAVVARYKINLITVKSPVTREEFIQFYGDDRLYERNKNECC